MTTYSITNEQIETLRVEADKAGDEPMVHACFVALGAREPGEFGQQWPFSREEARQACADAIAEARAMDGSRPAKDAATPYGYAAIGDDGNRPVVWGLGRTEEEAEEEARIQLVELGEDSNVDRVVPVTEAQWDRINGGDVSAEGL